MREPTTFAPAFGDEPVGSPDGRKALKKSSRKVWKIRQKVVTFASAFRFPGGTIRKVSFFEKIP